MPWWSWIVIWGCLVLAAIAAFVWLGYRIVTKFLAALHALEDLAAKTDVLQAHAESLATEHGSPAVFVDAALLGEQRRTQRAERAHWRQTRREARVREGKILVTADPQQYSHLLKRT
ncbi:MAG: hypothetical protein ABI310_04900 [Microbacteriaceae bacterium]